MRGGKLSRSSSVRRYALAVLTCVVGSASSFIAGGESSASPSPTGIGVRTTPVGTGPVGVVVASGSVWVANSKDGTVVQVDPASGKVTRTIAVRPGSSALGFAEGDLWVTNDNDNTIQRIDPEAGTIIATIPVGKDPENIAVAGGSVWIANSSGGVSRVDPSQNEVVQTIGDWSPRALSAVGSAIWSTTILNSDVYRIDATTGEQTAHLKNVVYGGGIAATDQAVWVAGGLRKREGSAN